MTFAPNSLYHIFNRGNNSQAIFFQERNYCYFLEKAVFELGTHLDFLAYCLMPNHFHFLVYAKPTIVSKACSDSFRTLLSSYSRAIQNQERRTGSLFQQNTKAREITNSHYAQTCFHYIHQNPLRAWLVKMIESWPHHSFNEYWKNKPGICNVALAKEVLTPWNQIDSIASRTRLFRMKP